MQQDITIRQQSDEALMHWRNKEKIALELLRLVGELRFEKSVDLVLFREDIYDSSPSEVLHKHRLAKNYINHPISVETSVDIASAILALPDLAPAKIDIGKLALEWQESNEQYGDLNTFIYDRLSHYTFEECNEIHATDVVLYGFGRIGRLAARRILAQTGRGEQLRLKAIVIRAKMKDAKAELEKRAALLRTDSIHGDFKGTVTIDAEKNQIIANGNRIQVIFAKQPTDIDYNDYGIHDALLIDNTGVWRDREGLSLHLRPGVSHVLLTAPGKGIPNIVHGINQNAFDPAEEKIFSAASCTTNAISPVIHLINNTFGIEKGHIETIHAYTSDQNLLDNFHKKPRRGRGAAVNMVLTSTGAASAVAKVIPEMAGKLTGNAVRVPTPNVSLAILNLSLKDATHTEAVNEVFRNAALYGDLVEQIHYSTDTEYVSSNAVGMNSTSVIDAPSTIVSEDGKNITVYAWYDNEFGYTCQLVRLAKYIAGVRRKCYY
jgi:glyceraldehyde 3-phosphate dehydrogenase